MVKITYIEHSGAAHVLDVETGYSVMDGAMRHGIRGILAECGGGCACATCHVYVDEAWLAKLPPKREDEEGLLDAVLEPRPNSRLSCQIMMTDELDGLVVRLPAKQI